MMTERRSASDFFQVLEIIMHEKDKNKLPCLWQGKNLTSIYLFIPAVGYKETVSIGLGFSMKQTAVSFNR